MEKTTQILLIEDDSGVGRSLVDGLEREGYDVVWKMTGGEGITQASDRPPHLVILDVRLPDASGFDICRRLRALDFRQPILMLTARREEADKVLGLEMGADDYLTKPFSLSELLAHIRALLRRAYGELSGTDSEVIYVADLKVDRGRGQVSRGAQAINLTPTEFRLLVHLSQHQGQALTRAQILDAVWGYDADVESERAVNVHVRRLREKIEVDPQRPALVLTVPGIGYRLVG